MTVTGTATSTATGGQTLADLKSICVYHGWSDTSTEGYAALARFINSTLMTLGDLRSWPEYMHHDGTITLAASDNDYTLSPDNIAAIGDIWRAGIPTPLSLISGVNEWLRLTKTQPTSGPPTRYTLRKFLSSGDVKIEVLVWPTPTAVATLYYPYKLYPVVLEGDADITDWPVVRLALLEKALEIRLAASDRDAGGMILREREFDRMVSRSFASARPSFMPLTGLSDITSRRYGSIRSVPFAVTT